MSNPKQHSCTKTFCCPSCLSHVDVNIMATGTVTDVNLKMRKKTAKPKKDICVSNDISIVDSKGIVFSKGQFDPKNWSKYYYGHNTLDVKKRVYKPRFVDDPDEFGQVGVRLERFMEIELQSIQPRDFISIYEDGTSITTTGGLLPECPIVMQDGDHLRWQEDGIGAFYNHPLDEVDNKRFIDLCFYDGKVGEDWPLEIYDPPLIHGQVRLEYDTEGLSQQVYFHKILLVESLVVCDKDKRARGHSTNGRYMMPYYVENKAGKRMKKVREYYDRNPDMFWLKNGWYQQFPSPFHN